MNWIPIQKVPTGTYSQITGDMADWETHFLTLINQRKRIQYDDYTPHPKLSDEIKRKLVARGYRCQILVTDGNQYYLDPRTK
jgi:hypothetical protein